ncbi:hypothetical protein ACFQV8_07725 [Pseudonocardia benzenivorans]
MRTRVWRTLRRTRLLGSVRRTRLARRTLLRRLLRARLLRTLLGAGLLGAGLLRAGLLRAGLLRAGPLRAGLLRTGLLRTRLGSSRWLRGRTPAVGTRARSGWAAVGGTPGPLVGGAGATLGPGAARPALRPAFRSAGLPGRRLRATPGGRRRSLRPGSATRARRLGLTRPPGHPAGAEDRRLGPRPGPWPGHRPLVVGATGTGLLRSTSFLVCAIRGGTGSSTAPGAPDRGSAVGTGLGSSRITCHGAGPRGPRHRRPTAWRVRHTRSGGDR